MSRAALEKRIAKAEAARSTTGDISSQILAARKTPVLPTHTRQQLEVLADRNQNDLGTRIAKALLRIKHYTDKPSRKTPPSLDTSILPQLAGMCYSDPLKFVMFAFPWGEPGFDQVKLLSPWSEEYDSVYGPDRWQCELFDQMRAEVEARITEGVTPPRPLRFSTVSGNGCGKSFFNAALVNFLITTRPMSKGVISANSAQQLESRTFAEVQKLLRRSLFAEWFRATTGKGSMRVLSREYPESWRADCISPSVPESAQGTHSAGSTAWCVLDEASAIPDELFNIMEALGATSEAWIIATGNGTRPSGRFYDSHHKQKDRWITRSVDSRDTQLCNHALIEDWLKAYGPESTFAAVRIYGQFAEQGSMTYFPRSLLEEAAEREAQVPVDEPIQIGVDVAAYGADSSVIWTKRGKDGKNHPPIKLNCDTMQLVHHVAEHINLMRLSGKRVTCAIDSTGLGVAVCDRLNQLGFGVHMVNFGSRPERKVDMCANRRAELYVELREWLQAGGAIPNDPELIEELAAMEYYFDSKGRIIFERKADLKSRIGRSPDKSDALALAVSALPVPVVDRNAPVVDVAKARREYNPLDRTRTTFKPFHR